jgi:hypothetical protein
MSESDVSSAADNDVQKNSPDSQKMRDFLQAPWKSIPQNANLVSLLAMPCIFIRFLHTLNFKLKFTSVTAAADFIIGLSLCSMHSCQTSPLLTAATDPSRISNLSGFLSGQ